VASEDQPCQTPMKKLQKKQQNKLQAWIELRKNTTPVHWVYGLLCAFLMLSWGILAGWVAMVAFGLLERWNDEEEIRNKLTKKYSGCTDFWESFVTFIPAQSVLALLSYLGIVSIGWW
jgi:hypothetical protein